MQASDTDRSMLYVKMHGLLCKMSLALRGQVLRNHLWGEGGPAKVLKLITIF